MTSVEKAIAVFNLLHSWRRAAAAAHRALYRAPSPQNPLNSMEKITYQWETILISIKFEVPIITK